jgi:hypothetical protein
MSAFVHVAPPTHVTAPVRQPQRFGLFSVASIIEQPEPMWQVGVEFEPMSCQGISGLSGICFDPDDGGPRNMPAGWPLHGGSLPGVDAELGLPFTVYGGYNCSAFSRPVAEAEARARQHLASGEEAEVEWSIVDGAWDNVPFFQDPNGNIVDLGGPFPIELGFGALEAMLAAVLGGPGVIHLPRSVAAYARSKSLFARQGQRLETELGNFVAAGVGYDLAGLGLQPGGQNVTLYATSVPTVRRSEVWTHPDPEFRPQRANNDMTVYAFRNYLVAWECQVIKVEVELPAEVPLPAPGTFQLSVGYDGPCQMDSAVLVDPEVGGLPAQLDADTEVTLTPVPGDGCTFVAWSGPGVPEGAENDDPLVLTMDGDKHVVAYFGME